MVGGQCAGGRPALAPGGAVSAASSNCRAPRAPSKKRVPPPLALLIPVHWCDRRDKVWVVQVDPEWIVESFIGRAGAWDCVFCRSLTPNGNRGQNERRMMMARWALWAALLAALASVVMAGR